MQISSIQTFKTMNTQSFQSQRNRPNVHKPRTDYKTYDYYEAYNGEIKQGNPNLKKKIAAITAAAAIAGSGIGGYVIGKNQTNDDIYLKAYNTGWKNAIIQMEREQNQQDNFMPAQTVPPVTTTTAPIVEEVVSAPIPEKVYALSDGRVEEFDLTEKPFLYNENVNVPNYFDEYNIDANTLKTAQGNMARVFESGDYIIISPNHTMTMAELKRVFGILDGVIAKEPLNELSTRPQTPGSDGNFDNAIIEADDAIRIKAYDSDRGHQVGVYTSHKSNKSRKAIAEEIIEWANK